MALIIDIHVRMDDLHNVEQAKKEIAELFSTAALKNITAGKGVDALIPLKMPEAAANGPAEAPEAGKASDTATGDKPQRVRRTRAQIEADNAAATRVKVTEQEAAESDEHEDPASDELDLLGDDPVPTATTITMDDIRETASKVMAKGVPLLAGILKEHGFAKVGQIPESAFAAVMADFNEALAP